MTSCTVMGCDPSLLGLAIASKAPGYDVQRHRFTSPQAVGVRARIERSAGLVERVMHQVRLYRPRLFVIEAYAFKFSGHGVADRVELGGMLRRDVLATGATIVEVSPTTLKKFAAGAGDADKADVMHGLRAANGGSKFETSDDADAFGLLLIGLCMTGQRKCENDKQREVIAMLLDKARDLERADKAREAKAS